MELLKKMVDHHVWLVGELIDRAATVPADKLDELVRVSVDALCEPAVSGDLH